MKYDIAFLWITKDKDKLTREVGIDACPLPMVGTNFYLQTLIDVAN